MLNVPLQRHGEYKEAFRLHQPDRTLQLGGISSKSAQRTWTFQHAVSTSIPRTVFVQCVPRGFKQC